LADSTEADNLHQIERLNQRGGRTLSVVDLVKAGTLSTEMAAVCAAAVARGASILTGAVPGGAGKTTLMASLLGFLAPGRPIITVQSAAALSRPSPDDDPVYLVHEIGSGAWYGYLWGPAVGRYIALAAGPGGGGGGGGSIASCLHADTVEEMRGILTSPPLSAEPADLDRVALMLFIARDGDRHRVTTMNVSAQGEGEGEGEGEGGGHACLFEWDERSGSHLRVGGGGDDAVAPLCELLGTGTPEFNELTKGVEGLLGDLVPSDVSAFEDVRGAFLDSGLR